MIARNKRAWIFNTIIFTAVMLGGTRAATAPPPALSEPTLRPIVQIVSRAHSIQVFSTPAGPRYSAKTAGGAILIDGISLEQLRISHPELYQEVRPGLAIADNDPTGPIGMIDTAE